MKKFLLIAIITISLSAPLLSSKSRQQLINELLSSVNKWMGTPYVYGGDSRNGIDCSAFTNRIYTEVFNKTLPRTVLHQKNLGTMVMGKLQPGDLVFFNIGGKISHVGIYVFDNKFIHAASAGNEVGVIKSSLTEKYYRSRFVYAKRLVDLSGSGTTITEKDIDEPLNVKSFYEAGPSTTGVNNNTITNQSDVVLFKIGSIIYNGEIRDMVDSYNAERELKYSIENINHRKTYFIISIMDLDSERVRKIHLFDIKKDKKILKGFNLPKGSYAIKLTTFNKEILFEKNIIVL